MLPYEVLLLIVDFLLLFGLLDLFGLFDGGGRALISGQSFHFITVMIISKTEWYYQNQLLALTCTYSSICLRLGAFSRHQGLTPQKYLRTSYQAFKIYLDSVINWVGILL